MTLKKSCKNNAKEIEVNNSQVHMNVNIFSFFYKEHSFAVITLISCKYVFLLILSSFNCFNFLLGTLFILMYYI